jgi:PhzF family phenazine biosynthesis protein
VETHRRDKEQRRAAVAGEPGLAVARRLDFHPPLVWLYASFPRGGEGGNPAGVVLSSKVLAPELAQSVAAVMSVPTTGFAVIDPEGSQQRVDVRFFTPEREIDACGHVTIAIATALVEQGVWHWGGDVVVRARGGEFPLRLRDGNVEMDQGLRVFQPAPLDWAEVEAALGRVRRHSDLPLAVVGTGLRHLLVPLAEVAALAKVALDATRIRDLASQATVDTICVFAPTDRPNRYRVRDLCAAIGAIEEPASGTTSGSLALYLAHEGHLATELVVEQGLEMGRPSRIDLRIRSPREVTVRGTARKVLSGILELPLDDGRG